MQGFALQNQSIGYISNAPAPVVGGDKVGGRIGVMGPLGFIEIDSSRYFYNASKGVRLMTHLIYLLIICGLIYVHCR